jgi:hypothetical protein
MKWIAKVLLLVLLVSQLIGTRAAPAPSPTALTETAYIGETEKNLHTHRKS